MFPVDLRGATAPTKMWANEWEVEPQALQQLRNISTLPWVRGIRVMPDVHLGKGATVGSVIAMKDAVSPNAVGVDIGCFTGDTLVTLLDSKQYRIDELARNTDYFHVYSCTEDAVVVGAEATAKLTRRDAPLVAVTLDNGEVGLNSSVSMGFLIICGIWYLRDTEPFTAT